MLPDFGRAPFLEAEGIDRACFYHLVYSGRGNQTDELTPDVARAAVDTMLRRTKDFAERGPAKEIFTVDNHADGPYLYLRLLREHPGCSLTDEQCGLTPGSRTREPAT